MDDSYEATGMDDGQAQVAALYPTLTADIAGSFTYASYQNAIPVVRSIAIENATQRHFSNCLVELVSTPTFLRQKSWTIDRLAPGDSLSLSDRKVELDAAYLAGLNEAERGDITLRLSVDGEVIDERHFPVRLLARDEWGGVGDMIQLLPAFVMPNDPAVARILRSAAEKLLAAGHSGGLDGYQSEDPRRAFLISAAIYSAIAGLGLHYAEPPASFEMQGQKVRRPATIEEDRLATCLDISLLVASAIEAAGLHPALLIFHNHAAAGVWLRKRTFANAVETDPMEVRKALASNELIIFETTGVILISAPANGRDRLLYGVTDLLPFGAAPERFYEFGYRETLRQMIDAVMERESPVRTDILCQRISRAHGWLRTGGKIRERIDLHLRDYDRTTESSGEFIWKKGAVEALLVYRAPESEEARRAIGDIPLAELASIVVQNPGLFEEPDPARELARLLGVERLAAASRSRLDEAINKAREHIFPEAQG